MTRQSTPLDGSGVGGGVGVEGGWLGDEEE